MINVNVCDVAKAVGGLLIGDSSAFIKGVSTDSRNIEAHNLFVPLVGANFDGHSFIEDVFKKQAGCTLIQKDHKRPEILGATYIVVDNTLKALQDLAKYYIRTINPYVIAVTGSNGKTSVKDMLCSIMNKKFKTDKTSGNHNNEIGVPLSILNFDKDIKCAVIEMGVEHFGDIDLLSSIVRPNVSIITTIGSAHMLNFNNSKKEIARAKLEIYSNLKDDGYMFYNKESKEIEQVLSKMDNTSKKRFAFGEGSDLRVDGEITYEDSYTTFKTTKTNAVFKIDSLGKHQVTNALGCIGIGLKEGISEKDIADALKETEFAKMRCDVVKIGNAIVVDDTYKSNPESARAAIDSLDEFKGFRKVICFSDMLELGPNEIKMHKELGKYIHKTKGVVDTVCTGPLSKFIVEKAKGEWFGTKEECAKYLRKYLNDETVILIKGSRATQMDKVVELLRKAVEE